MKISDKNLVRSLNKDISDYQSATKDRPSKILIRQEIYDALKTSRSLDENGGYQGIELQITEYINKDWVIV